MATEIKSKHTPSVLSSSQSGFRKLAKRVWGERGAVIGGAIILFFVILALLGFFGLTPYPVIEQHPLDRLSAPSEAYLLGTDQFGRDVASRIMKGTTNSLEVALLSVTISTLAGTLIGAISGYIGGLVDNIIMRLMDIIFAFPGLLLALLIVTILGPGLYNTVLAISIVYTPIFARVARGQVILVKEMDYVTAARSLGKREFSILLRHVIPNIMSVLIVQVTLALSWALITEAGLSFLGLGTQQPEPSLGLMLSSNRALAEIAPWLILYPGLAIMLMVLGFNLLGDGLRDLLDPRSRGR
ncbi:ABC transporter permease [Phototrophicus methaneseepsis]|uniref:ABC transporter permease n=1 Tax=Phototrophicus methaneseepsis TaxID=2710758 RepID=A0A7S8E597_9CHLR|nr:ABC transporter permease [Phototrophicus methaneseepsis]QPC80643.1 ABC transporter permease [Phototrophicus methaneseepsis]